MNGFFFFWEVEMSVELFECLQMDCLDLVCTSGK